MRHIVLAACLAASTALTPAVAEEIPGSQFETGNWVGAAHTDDRGAFSHCAVSVGYTDDETLWIGLYPNDTLSILLTHPDVTFNPGDQFDMTIMMETGLPWTGVGEAWDQYFAGITWEGIQPTVDFLVSGQYLRMLGIGIDGGYDVQGIPDALALAQTCLAQNSGVGGKVLGVTPGKTPPPPKVPDLSKPRTSGTGAGSVLGTPAPKPAP